MKDLSQSANQIVQAGIDAANRADIDPFDAADRAVRQAVGELGLTDPSEARGAIINNLMEIAQLHVRQQLQRG